MDSARDSEIDSELSILFEDLSGNISVKAPQVEVVAARPSE